MLHFRLDLFVSHDRIVVMYFFASLVFLVAGLCLSLFTQTVQVHYIIGWGSNIVPPPGPPLFVPALRPYFDLGSRLFGFGIFLVAATFYQSLAWRRTKSLLNIGISGVIE